MFTKKMINFDGREALLIEGLEDYSLVDTFECGQCFRHVRLTPDSEARCSPIAGESEYYVEYMTVVGERLVFVGQRNRSELIFFGVGEDDFDELAEYFALKTDYGMIREDILSRTDSEFLINATSCAAGIRILRQDPWETLFSFIISQNNNIPRIMGIIRKISLQYGKNLASSLGACPIECGGFCKGSGEFNTDKCLSCGACYTFPSASAVAKSPEGLLESRPGFRYKYLVDAAEKVLSGEVNLDEIYERHSYEYTLEQLQKIKGVGEKVASCASLFAFSNLNAFPIDVWMRRAIDEYFDGKLDPKTLGDYAGVAQQYIFHYIRALSKQ